MRTVVASSLLATLTLTLGCGGTATEERVVSDSQALASSKGHHVLEPEHQLVAWAALPQSKRTPGPTSGQFITPANGVVPPFVNAQPIPGWSGLLENPDGTFLGMPDNGFGAKGNSSDFVLGYYQVRADFKTCSPSTRSNAC